MNPQRVLFEHVPKCGGTSIVNYLMSQYRQDQVFYIRGVQATAYIDYYRRLPRHQTRFHLVVGHGAHHLLDAINDEWITLTVLRDPVQRIISHYNYVLRTPNHYLYEQVATAGMSLEAYATSGLTSELQNNFVCWFTGKTPEEAIQAPEQSVEEAFQVLQERYDIVGTLEQLEPTMQVLQEKAGFTHAFGGRKLNATAYKTPPSAVLASTKHIIAEVNALDVHLYERVASLAPQAVVY